ncbi:hypothetical protein L1987_14531 [Smallanthus sonchifolius]|uniref:Uncharacterized protein n=1 Tax=Smallanthus sonchifolius TaxID=185202 RepID=A0ACB9J2Z4_9ASTR|nr:hypothetical protein L1987_14531 [Smallanthus sonchifolius]
MLLALILGSCSNGVQGRLMSTSADSASSTSQTLKGLQAGAKESFKKILVLFKASLIYIGYHTDIVISTLLHMMHDASLKKAISRARPEAFQKDYY